MCFSEGVRWKPSGFVDFIQFVILRLCSETMQEECGRLLFEVVSVSACWKCKFLYIIYIHLYMYWFLYTTCIFVWLNLTIGCGRRFLLLFMMRSRRWRWLYIFDICERITCVLFILFCCVVRGILEYVFVYLFKLIYAFQSLVTLTAFKEGLITRWAW